MSSILALIAVPQAASAAVTLEADGRSLFDDLRAFSAGVFQTVDQINAPEIEGVGIFRTSGDATLGSPVFEFAMDNSLFGQSDIQANFNFYLTQAGVDNDGDGIELRYAQGNGVVEFADTNGSVAGTFDPAVTGWHSLDISPAVQQAADNNWSYLRLNMYPDDWRNGTDRIFVAASENSGFEPTVTIVPEPTTAMILFFMVGGSFFARRR